MHHVVNGMPKQTFDNDERSFREVKANKINAGDYRD